MAKNDAPIIVIKRVKKGGHGHHGGAWKIAYADFVTAMMAFFLLMWVLGSTTAGDLAGISSYFQNPLRVSLSGGQGSGDATRIIKGGGDNISKTVGEESRADADTEQRRISDSSVTDVENEVHVSYQGKRYSFSKLGENVTDYYNMISAISTCIYTGLSIESILSYFKKIELVKSRFNVSEKSGKRIIVMMSKDQNPVAASRVFDYIRKQNQRRTGIIYINENSDHHTGSENSSWYYDADFEYLKQDHIKQIIFGGWRVLDAKVRCLLAGIDDSIILSSDTELNTSILIDFSKVDDIYVLYGTKTEAEAHQVKEDLLKRIEKEI